MRFSLSLPGAKCLSYLGSECYSSGHDGHCHGPAPAPLLISQHQISPHYYVFPGQGVGAPVKARIKFPMVTWGQQVSASGDNIWSIEREGSDRSCTLGLWTKIMQIPGKCSSFMQAFIHLSFQQHLLSTCQMSVLKEYWYVSWGGLCHHRGYSGQGTKWKIMQYIEKDT